MVSKAVPMLAIAGGKGGCGKTTTTLGLAGALAERGDEPLVVDGDCDMPDVHHRLGLSRTKGVEALADGSAFEQATVRSPELPGVAILTGGRRDELDAALPRVARWDGPVLVDCGAGTNPDAVRPLRHADRTVVVSTDQPQCIEDAALTRTIAERLPTALEGVVVRATASTPTSTAFPGEWSVLGEVPLLDDPLNDQQAGQTFLAVSKKIFPGKRKQSTVYTNEDGVYSRDTSDNYNHQRYCRRNI